MSMPGYLLELGSVMPGLADGIAANGGLVSIGMVRSSLAVPGCLECAGLMGRMFDIGQFPGIGDGGRPYLYKGRIVTREKACALTGKVLRAYARHVKAAHPGRVSPCREPLTAAG